MQYFDSFQLDIADECLWQRGTRIALPPKQFAVLRYLVEHPGRLISHDELLDALWPETYVQPQVLRTYVLELRKILGDDARQPRFIQSLPKRGYRFVAPVNGNATVPARPAVAEHPPAQNAALAGRTTELNALHAHFNSLAHNKRQIVFLTGQTGIGKTALIDAFCRGLDRVQKIVIARGQCVQGFAGREAYYPLLEALGELCAPPHDVRMRPLLADKAPSWLPALDRRPQTEAVSLTQEHSMTELCSALEAIAADAPLVLVIEDLHWADGSTLDLIAALAHRRAPAQLMLLASVGPHNSEAMDLKRTMNDLQVHGLCAQIPLAPLRHEHVESLLRDTLHQDDLPHDLSSVVHETSEGNPLFAIAMVRHLQAQQFLVRQGHSGQPSWEARVPLREIEAGIPGELEQMIELEIGHLSPREQRVLEAASLFSVAFPAWAVAAALEDDIAVIEEACDTLARRLSVIKRAGLDELPDGTCSAFYVFAHGLYREVLYQRQTLAVRARSHIRIAEQLRTMFAGCEASVAREIARHFESAGQRASAIATLRNAARVDAQRQAYGAATDHLHHALLIAENLHDAERQSVTRSLRSELIEATRATGNLEDPDCARQQT